MDDKGRVSVPAWLREEFGTTSLVVTKGIEASLWLYPPEGWKKLEPGLRSRAKTLPTKEANKFQHKFLLPAREIEIDKTGRIALPQPLRDYAGLSRECIFLKNGNMIELWDTARYDIYQSQIDADVPGILDNMDPIDFTIAEI
ncbi:MAG: cell division/cell wall cluster transcriptional repressor MraZ [Treponema sp.]|jgi:MraZ protein|nr:cell division/cell wall cluster transcriptional repressor MraZ [Treponema sp.]